jgi:hemerythrin
LTNKTFNDKNREGVNMINKMVMNTPNHQEVVPWSSSFSVGIKIIDEQHKGLLYFVNDLFNHSSGNEEEELKYFKEVVQKVIEYIKNHFSTEEKLLLAAKFPGYIEHKKAHDEFTFEVIKSVRDFESGKRLVLEKFAYFLKDWILAHIAVKDKQYVAHFKEIASHKTSE